MIKPSKALDAQSGCNFFKLAAETRNQIYDLVYAAETNKDGAIELNETTAPPCRGLLMTCQQIYNESRKVYKAAYRDYPTKFTIDIADRHNLPFIPALDNKLLRRMESLVVIWRPDEPKDQPLRFTSTFELGKVCYNGLEIEADANDASWQGPQAADKVLFDNRIRGTAMEGLNVWFLHVSDVVSSRRERWQDRAPATPPLHPNPCAAPRSSLSQTPSARHARKASALQQ
jgi:hypothetical protein